MFVSRQDALAEDLPQSVPICSVLGADEVGPLIAVETPLSRLILDLFRTHPALPNRLLPAGFSPATIYQPLPAVLGWSRPEMTCWSRVRALAPVIRYRLGWSARVLHYSHLCDALSREKVLPPRQLKRLIRIESPCWKLPLIAMANA